MQFVEQPNATMANFAKPQTNSDKANVVPGVNALNVATTKVDYNEGIFQFRVEAGQEFILPLHNLLMSSINDNGVCTIQSTAALADVRCTTEPTHIVEQERKRLVGGQPGPPTAVTWNSLTVGAGTIIDLPDNTNGLYVSAGSTGCQVTVRRS
jgi:hypothetical protein